MYNTGEGVVKNKEEAFKWFMKAAEQGDAEAQYTVGAMYNTGEGVVKNKEEGFKWLMKAAEEGDKNAQFNVGKMFDTGEGAAQNKEEAFKWYNKAAEQGDAVAQYNVGIMYYNGIGVMKNPPQAIYWLKKALEQGYKEAQLQLAYAYEDNKDYSQAFLLYNQIADEGNVSGFIHLGIYYEHGLGISKDIQKAIYWYQRAAQKEVPSALSSLGFFYEMGVGVEKDEKKAFSLYKQSAEKGDSFGQRMLAFAYRDAMGTPQNNDLAIYWMGKAKENGDKTAEEILPILKNLILHEKLYDESQPEEFGDNTNITVIMNKRNSVYYVPCKINGEKADFIFDTGAGAISLSSVFAKRLIALGLLSEDDITGQTTTMNADGGVNDVLVANIKDVEIGGLHLYNIKAIINEQQNAPLLLGQSAIEKLGKITIDGYKLIIHR